MPIPFDDNIEAGFQRVLARLKAKEDAENGAGAFDHSVQRGQLLMQKRADELTPEEAAFLNSPPPAKRQS
ncbi:hypothetical protein JI58_07220 [Marinosulfonomonas sp. PRT-SC04]|nr:hypothetical protein JI58_07220 [Marinosulfonomonas sp. PRT-SC04]